MNLRVLVCDDEVHIVRAVSMKLSKAGFDVETAADGQAAWEAIERETPALVLSDLQMPRVDGLTLCRHMRANDATRQTPILLLTAKGFELDEAELEAELHPFRMMVKPFSPRELLHAVQESLGLVAST